MIVKNEEENLGNCLKNAGNYADEIIIVDTGSTDKTKDVARKYTDKVFDFEWFYDFSKARNFSFERATSEYIIWLDADDLILEESIKAINRWKESEDESDVLMCPYITGFDEKFNSTFEFNRERIVKNNPLFRWKDPVHEVIVPQGKIKVFREIKVYHNKKNKPYTDRNLSIYLKLKEDGIEFSPRQQFYFARELYFNGKIDDAIHEFSKFIADKKGWIENNIEACLNLSKCYSIKNELDKALTSLFGSFTFDSPRGEIVYEIGNVFMEKGQYDKAIYWYNLAMNCIPKYDSGAFINKDCYDFLPSLKLCVCYDKLGDYLTAYKFHKITENLKPNDKAVQINKKYFENLFNKKIF